MKTLLTFILSCIITFSVNATVHVVDNNPNNTTAFATIQEAVDAASDNDTIYIQPSSSLYPNVILTKPLVLFGAGRNPNKQNHNLCKIDDLRFNTSASGSTIRGLVIKLVQILQPNVNNITITHCEITRLDIRGDNYFVENCVLGKQDSNFEAIKFYISDGPYDNIIIQNNIIAAKIRAMQGSGSALRNNLILPNQFHLTAFHTIELGEFITVENNIFYGQSPGNCSSCDFNNNITFQTAQDALPYGNNTGINNLIWFENGFVNAPLPVITFLDDLYSHDINLDTDAPGLGGGTDGNDIGLFGGSSPFSMYGEPPIPVVREFTLENATVPIDGTLQISVNSSSPE
ncbi:MAG: hypothetical protein DRI54_02715 [Bacteroidetes bacterium]|nr:MAG: hypothetical protein DRI54_02715 [Bacteroidota bacterium]